MASHYDIASLVKCVILIVPANDAHFYKNITGKYKYSEKYIKNDILYLNICGKCYNKTMI